MNSSFILIAVLAAVGAFVVSGAVAAIIVVSAVRNRKKKSRNDS